MKAKKELGNYLRELRTKRKLSQTDISERLGFSSPQFVSNWERGSTIIPPTHIRAVAKMLGVKPVMIADKVVDVYRERVFSEI